eukprot:gene265-6680_t
MNNNSTTPMLSFTVNDGIFISLQGVTVLFTMLLLLIFCLFRKEKALKYRGCIPYFSVFGVWLLIIRKFSFTYNFSCWWSLIISAPVLLLFVVFQMLSVLQYLINKRIDSLKDLTWGLFDTAHEKTAKGMAKRLKTLNLSSNRSLDSYRSTPLTPKSDRNLLSPKGNISPLDLKSNKDMEKTSKSLPQTPKTKNVKFTESEIELKNISPRNELELPTSLKLPNLTSNENLSEHSDEHSTKPMRVDHNNETTDDLTTSNTMSVDLDEDDIKNLHSMFFKLKIAKFFGSFIFKAIVIILSTIIIVLGHVGIQGGLDIATKGCTYDRIGYANGVSSLITPIFLFFLLIANLVIMLVDAALFIKENGFKPKVYYLVDDPYGFRIEHLIGVTILILLSPITIATLVGDLLQMRNGSPNIFTTRGELFSIGVSLTLVVIEWMVLIALTPVGVILSIFAFIKRLLQPVVYDSEFEAFIKTKTGKQIFKKYAKKEWSLENILFFEDVEKYQKIWIYKVAKKRATELIKNYIEVGSPLELNLSGDTRRLTKTKVKNFRDYKEVYKHIFNDAIRETRRNMKDTYARIIHTNDFREWKASTKILVDDDSGMMSE